MPRSRLSPTWSCSSLAACTPHNGDNPRISRCVAEEHGEPIAYSRRRARGGSRRWGRSLRSGSPSLGLARRVRTHNLPSVCGGFGVPNSAGTRGRALPGRITPTDLRRYFRLIPPGFVSDAEIRGSQLSGRRALTCLQNSPSASDARPNSVDATTRNVCKHRFVRGIVGGDPSPIETEVAMAGMRRLRGSGLVVMLLSLIGAALTISPASASIGPDPNLIGTYNVVSRTWGGRRRGWRSQRRAKWLSRRPSDEAPCGSGSER